ncbi:MAG: 1-acyl-sn-glycerol-3-phosphate acyltransferase [Treponema sp.]|jgi:1-acyl-sn-glycerol-3-phosphate acyltransferase|nr:1-acyl-sn-glycerol-3-phosphate acyltransferase [Treponema sp.]
MPEYMPPIRSYPRYCWRVAAKWLSFLVFGAGTLGLIFLVFPVQRLFSRTAEDFKRRGRRTITAGFRFLVGFMDLLGVARLETADREAFGRLRGKILVANHPSLLDIVMLVSLIPNADCIVNAALLRNLVQGVIKQLYIPNSLNFEELSARCAGSLAQGNCLVIFPEGTRTPRSGPIRVQKGAARLSLLTGRPVVPVRIGGNDKWGLGKKDPWTAYNHTETYRYELCMLEEISPETYAGLPCQGAAKQMNEKIKEALFRPLGREIR